MGPVQTVTVRGAGGWTFEMDVPPAGTLARERFDEQLAKAELVLVDDEGRTLAPADVPTDITAPAPAAGGDGADDGLEALSAKDLRALAADRGVDVTALKRKADIVAALRVAATVEADDVADATTAVEDDDFDLDDLDDLDDPV
jgi:hypothetical protein